ncbi:MAG: 1-deoxy-D-xylulose-5-phosphate reductoisomerase [Nanoarchaeota archaeon]|nr:1-deoxy-D-xylulose-5-phosphate reductoisomerase [Nanoarchaeota archaeon]MBU1703975.1 1-deoxy-D-xylulose-5-phosphate reductoisomerase [Nanoarchaeota archaeon]
MKRIAILGSTGSIGTQALDVVSNFPDEFQVVGLSANSNIELLEEQIKRFKPKAVCVVDQEKAKELASRVDIPVFSGHDGLIKIAELEDYEVLLTSVVGASGLKPTIHAIRKGKHIALANKETLVTAGSIVMKEAKEHNVQIIPVDSEHSAVQQCLLGEKADQVENIILTCSGGPFRGKTKEDLKDITVKEALNHPKWSMGKKISIDSATLMNKGLEVIEAHWLFNVAPEKIAVQVHPQALVHSMVEYKDGTVKAQIAEPDARLPIQYALFYPERTSRVIKKIQFREMTFEDPDLNTFPCLQYAYDAIKKGGTMPCVMNAANEIAVDAFLKGQIKFLDIHKIIKKVMEKHNPNLDPNLQDIIDTDIKTRTETKILIQNEFSK